MRKILPLFFLLISVSVCMLANAQHQSVPNSNEKQSLGKEYAGSKNKEVLVILQGYYGTGMAHATFNLSKDTPRVITALVTWHVSAPPLTPDTAACEFNFIIDKTIIDRIIVIVRREQMKIDGSVELTEINRIDVSVNKEQEEILINLNK